MRYLSLVFLVLSGLSYSVNSSWAFPQDQGTDKQKNGGDEITLEKLFPEESLFGPQASSMAFSKDGRYVAFLYRTYAERRHGNDLWLYDFETEQLSRITDVAAMSEFQRSARRVKEDRLAKHKAKLEKEKKEQEGAAEKGKKNQQADAQKQDNGSKNGDAEKDQDRKRDKLEEERQVINRVDDKDAEDRQAPRYSGVSGFAWHPTENSMLIFSEGDIYQITDVAEPALSRITNTVDSIAQVAYLPDGSGYTYNQNQVVYRVRFGHHFIEQLNPRLPQDLSLGGYELSQDGTKLAILARSGSGMPQGSRTVDIIRYRDRFAKADSVPRTVSDDATKPQDTYVYLYDLESARDETAELIQVFQTKIDDPRDVISRPLWSPDSSKVTFCFYDQTTDEVQIFVASFPDDAKLKELRKKRKPPSRSEAASRADDSEEDSEQRRRGGRMASSTTPDILEDPARVVYRFMHYGGPNTPRMVSPNWAWDSKRIVFLSEQTGFRHLHLLDPLYETVQSLTSGNYEVYPQQFSGDNRTVFVTATKDSPARELVYAVDLESLSVKKISRREGNYSSVAVSDDGTKLVGNFVTYGNLPELLVQNQRGRARLVTESHPAETKKLTAWMPEFFDYENRHGHTIHGMMFKPQDWDASKKYPLLIYVYGGPLGTRKSVTDGSYSADGYFFQGYMTEKHEYVTVVIDPRGQSGYGGLFEKANYEQVGKPQVEDLVDGVKFLTENFSIDNRRVGIFGWSFGGFQTQMCLYTEPDVFQVGIAGAGPTEWENYNAWYTTGTVGPSQTGKPDQKKYSLRPLAKNLKGKMLLIHGVEDTNVLFQDTIAVYRELLQAGKETNVELFIDPTGGHGLGGDVKRLNRMRKYEDFLLRTLGAGASANEDLGTEETADAKQETSKERENQDSSESADSIDSDEGDK
ncbi:MAG TPA: prolyl oligopeptidase family serine peptidase [Pirellulaceae bacterium]|nr:prolyl oligopeptidase family serine peptidase [Pirellulaceae bacterium]HMO90708.1 prolyl oligopeptidase family serine peptidase [Pirellulaceae bacterium]HMP71086.1 prolyl oligopeptidase family serine peptidase [Pirellulaceae bacterium]